MLFLAQKSTFLRKYQIFTSKSFSFWVLSSKRFIYVVFHAYLWCFQRIWKDQYEAQLQIFQIILNCPKIQNWLLEMGSKWAQNGLKMSLEWGLMQQKILKDFDPLRILIILSLAWSLTLGCILNSWGLELLILSS